MGLSPRVRGIPLSLAAMRGFFGSIPACAGDTHIARYKLQLPRVYPRVCGGYHMIAELVAI